MVAKTHTPTPTESPPRTLILGLGDSGWAMARWLFRQGTPLRVWDSRERPPHADALTRELPGVELLAGPLTISALENVDQLIKTPGWPPHREPVASLLAQAQRQSLPVLGEVDLFEEALKSLRLQRGYAPEVLCITGTNGKTTTTAWTTHLLRQAGVSARSAGNIGPSMLEALMQALDTGSLPKVWVLELSSFQLQDAAQAPNCRAAAITNLSPDHLDWHGTLGDYAQSKRKALARAQGVILNADDADVAAWGRDDVPTVYVGVSLPEQAGSFGLVDRSGAVWLAQRITSDGRLVPLVPVSDLPLRGRHNAVNALMALALAYSVNADLQALLPGLRTYVAEPHRLQPCGQWRGVSAFDDSKGTNVGATVAALQGLGAELAPGRLVVILGGDGKGQQFDALIAPLQNRGRAVALIGRDAPVLAQTLGSLDIPVQNHSTLDAAVAWGFGQALPGDALLLSPACASWDMFKDYGHRGDCFARAVADWGREHSS